MASSQVWDERQLVKLQVLTRQLLAENNVAADDFRAAFQQYDVDGDGLIDEVEFTNFVVRVLRLPITKRELTQLWRLLDVNHVGAISMTEFTAVLFPDATENRVTSDGPTAAPASMSRSSEVHDGDGRTAGLTLAERSLHGQVRGMASQFSAVDERLERIEALLRGERGRGHGVSFTTTSTITPSVSFDGSRGFAARSIDPVAGDQRLASSVLASSVLAQVGEPSKGEPAKEATGSGPEISSASTDAGATSNALNGGVECWDRHAFYAALASAGLPLARQQMHRLHDIHCARLPDGTSAAADFERMVAVLHVAAASPVRAKLHARRDARAGLNAEQYRATTALQDVDEAAPLAEAQKTSPSEEQEALGA